MAWLFGHQTTTAQSQWVRIDQLDTSIHLDLRYASERNLFQASVYPEPVCWLRQSVAERLQHAQTALTDQGYSLKLWDCYRPLSVQRQMWQLVPDARYVANPTYGSRHNRGAAVDVTLATSDGESLALPTDFDDFSPLASPYRHAQWDPEAQQHFQILDQAMTQAGFQVLSSEWWHYDSPDWNQYPVSDLSFETLTEAGQ